VSLQARLRHELGDFALRADVRAERGVNVLFGASGTGKSTFLHLVAGLQRPRAGTVSLDGRVLTDVHAGLHVPARRRDIGMVFQEPLLLPHRSAGANVALAVRDRDRRRRRDEAHAWLERVGIGHLHGRRPGALSGGQQQRVALARALAGHPRLLLLDEPFSSLDADVRRRLGHLVRDLVHHQGLVALFVTHDRTEVAEVADRVLLADDGRIGAVVDPRSLLARPPGERPATG
jgi:ABC-type sulfate/molybdate transport systems ATPase subunit